MAIKVWRWAVFLLTLFYVLRMIVLGDWGAWGGPLRFLTLWALLMSFLSAGFMLARTLGWSQARRDPWVNATAVVNLMVVFLYWRLYFADPTSVTQNGELGVWWKEYYLHLLGPMLQWIDALFLHRAFRRLRASAVLLIGVILSYVVWTELLVGPMNASPVGSVTSGLPYRFLNNLDLMGRGTFYASNLIIALVVLAGFAAAAWLIRRLLPQEAP
jgi:hypothetical protein